MAPDPDWIRQAHENGVSIYGTVFLAEPNHDNTSSGKLADCLDVAKPDNLKRLVDIAVKLNFERWLINVESFHRNRSEFGTCASELKKG